MKVKGRLKAKVLIEFGLFEDEVVCRVRRINIKNTAVRLSNSTLSIMNLFETVLEARLTDQPFVPGFIISIEPRGMRGVIGKESGSVLLRFKAKRSGHPRVTQMGKKIYDAIIRNCELAEKEDE